MQQNKDTRQDSIMAVLLDIEGTTTPFDFVYETLFPYARTHMTDFLATRFDEADRVMLLEEYTAETSATKPNWTEPPVVYLLWLMYQDRKSRGLKNIQGKIWERGYRDGSLKGAVYPDVPLAMRAWKQQGRKVYIYSSGSMQAQQLLFAHSTYGDLTPLIDGYFDTEVGAKREASSYRTISGRIGLPPSGVLFITDVAAECDAAFTAGFQAILAVRNGNQTQPGSYPAISTFSELFSQIETRPEPR